MNAYCVLDHAVGYPIVNKKAKLSVGQVSVSERGTDGEQLKYSLWEDGRRSGTAVADGPVVERPERKLILEPRGPGLRSL